MAATAETSRDIIGTKHPNGSNTTKRTKRPRPAAIQSQRGTVTPNNLKDYRRCKYLPSSYGVT